MTSTPNISRHTYPPSSPKMIPCWVFKLYTKASKQLLGCTLISKEWGKVKPRKDIQNINMGSIDKCRMCMVYSVEPGYMSANEHPDSLAQVLTSGCVIVTLPAVDLPRPGSARVITAVESKHITASSHAQLWWTARRHSSGNFPICGWRSAHSLSMIHRVLTLT